MRHNRLNEFLEGKPEFDIEISTDTRSNKHGKLLLGIHSSQDIDKITPTLAKYSMSKTRILNATYQLEHEMLSGIGVLDEWREFPTDEFNVYGFTYDVDFEDFRFRMLRKPKELEENQDSIVEVENPDMSRSELQKLGSFCMSKAFVDLVSNKQLLV